MVFPSIFLRFLLVVAVAVALKCYYEPYDDDSADNSVTNSTMNSTILDSVAIRERRESNETTVDEEEDEDSEEGEEESGAVEGEEEESGVGNGTVPREFESVNCSVNTVCILRKYIDEDGVQKTARGCTTPDQCSDAGTFCCKTDLCNLKKPNQSEISGITCGDAEFWGKSHIDDEDSLIKCEHGCSRSIEIVSNNDDTFFEYVHNFGCIFEKEVACPIPNGCVIMPDETERCCCDNRDNCHKDLPKSLLVLPEADTHRVSCYDSTEGKKQCGANAVCAKMMDGKLSCTYISECEEDKNILYCCLYELCNDDGFEERKRTTTCTTGVFNADGSTVIPVTPDNYCLMGCERIESEGRLTFGCASTYCIGQSDGCEGDVCCCFADDCANTVLYPLPPQFESIDFVLKNKTVPWTKGDQVEEEEDPTEGADERQVEQRIRSVASNAFHLLSLLLLFLLLR